MTQIKEAINAEEDVISTDVDVVPSSIIIGNLRRINTDQHKTIDDLEAELRDEMQQKYVAIRLGAEKAATVLRLNETISDLRMAASDMLDTIDECARGEAADSMVLMQIVEIIKDGGLRTMAWHQIHHIVEDYLDAPESPVVALKTPSMGTRVVQKNEETPIINEDVMEAVWPHTIDPLSDHIVDWDRIIEGLEETLKLERIDHAAEKSAVKKTLHETITKLKALNDALRIDVADRDRYIEELNVEIKQFRDINMESRSLVDAGVIADKQAVIMINNQATTIEEKNTVLRAYREENTDVWSKLARIENFVDGCVIFTKEYIIDEITKIIQEE